tara:strand:- start:1041 stop:2282 length:1242 start_codon:yes stop_codon:yes gene_type:complete
MKEIVLNAGGRRLYNEDLVEIQEHSISLQNIFASEVPFVISGLNYTNTGGTIYDISSAYIWLGGKIRTYAGTTGVDLATPLYLNVNNSSSSTLYDDGVTRVSSTNFALLSSATGSGGNDQLRIDEPNNVRRYYENVIGDKYLKLSVGHTQELFDDLTMNGALTSSANITTSAQLNSATLSVTGNATIGGTLGVTGNTTLENIQVNGTANFAQNIDAVGKVTANSGFSVGAQIVVNSNAEIHSDRVVAASIALGAVTNPKLATNSVSTLKIVDDAVTNAKMATNSVDTLELVDGAVTNAKMAIDSVDTDNIVNGAITDDKLGFNTLQYLAFGQQNEFVYGAGLLGTYTVTHNQNIAGSDYHVATYPSSIDAGVSISIMILDKSPNSFKVQFIGAMGSNSGTVNILWYMHQRSNQ